MKYRFLPDGAMTDVVNSLALRLDRFMGIDHDSDTVTIRHGTMRAVADALAHSQKRFGGVDVEFYAEQEGSSHGIIGLLIMFVTYPQALSLTQIDILMQWLATTSMSKRAKCPVYWGKNYEMVMENLKSRQYENFESRILPRFVETETPTDVSGAVKFRLQRASALLVILGRMMKTVQGVGIGAQTVMDVDWVYNFIGGGSRRAKMVHGGGHFDSILQTLGASRETIALVNSTTSKLWASASSTWTKFVGWAKTGFEQAKMALNGWKARNMKSLEQMIASGGAKLSELGLMMRSKLEKGYEKAIEYYRREVAPHLKYNPEKVQLLKKKLNDFAERVRKYFADRVAQWRSKAANQAVLEPASPAELEFNAPMERYSAPAPTERYAAPAPVERYSAPEERAPAPAERYAAPTERAPAPMERYAAPAPVGKYSSTTERALPQPTSISFSPGRSSPSDRGYPSYERDFAPMERATPPMERAPPLMERAPHPMERAPAPREQAPSMVFTNYSPAVMASNIADLQTVAEQVGNYIKGFGSANPVSVSMFLSAAGSLAEKYAKRQGFVMDATTRHTFQSFVNGGDIGNMGINNIISTLKKIIASSEIIDSDGTRRMSYARGIAYANVSSEDKRALIEFLTWSKEFAAMAMEGLPSMQPRQLGGMHNRQTSEPGFSFAFSSGKILNRDMLVFVSQLEETWEAMLDRMVNVPFNWNKHSLQEMHAFVVPTQQDSIASFSKVCNFMATELAVRWNIDQSRVPDYMRETFDEDISEDYNTMCSVLERITTTLRANATVPGYSEHTCKFPNAVTMAEKEAILRFSKTFMNPRAIMQSDLFAGILTAVEAAEAAEYENVIRIPEERRGVDSTASIYDVVNMLVRAKRMPATYGNRREDIRFCLGVLAKNIDAFADWAKSIIKHDIGNFASLPCDEENCSDIADIETELSIPHTLPVLNNTGAAPIMARVFASQASPGYFLISSLRDE